MSLPANCRRPAVMKMSPPITAPPFYFFINELKQEFRAEMSESVERKGESTAEILPLLNQIQHYFQMSSLAAVWSEVL